MFFFGGNSSWDSGSHSNPLKLSGVSVNRSHRRRKPRCYIDRRESLMSPPKVPAESSVPGRKAPSILIRSRAQVFIPPPSSSGIPRQKGNGLWIFKLYLLVTSVKDFDFPSERNCPPGSSRSWSDHTIHTHRHVCTYTSYISYVYAHISQGMECKSIRAVRETFTDRACYLDFWMFPFVIGFFSRGFSYSPIVIFRY